MKLENETSANSNLFYVGSVIEEMRPWLNTNCAVKRNSFPVLRVFENDYLKLHSIDMRYCLFELK